MKVKSGSAILNLPILSELVRDGFPYGANYVVEFDPNSMWFETSLTIAAQTSSKGILTDYHTFMRAPRDVRQSMGRLGVSVERLEESGILRIIDSYTITTGLSSPEHPDWASSRSLNLADWVQASVQEVKEGAAEEDKKRLHIDDNTSVLLRYNDEKDFIDYWRTKFIPHNKSVEALALHSLATGVASEAFYRQFESLCDGTIDFACREEGGRLERYVRVRAIREKPVDSRWWHLQLANDGRVSLDATNKSSPELGIGRWLKGPRR